ncbi:MAG TPA: hypothetical protein VFV70_15055 [Hyphomonadaceae bacterium]|nr:hypothetical protein [Hyphomonadaceae bacterium]
MYRTVQEQRDITNEAERRVRAGERQSDVADALGLPRSTVAHWARLGGWRRKDLISVRDAERGALVLELINEVVAEEHEKRQAEAARLREALEASRAEIEAADPTGKLSGAIGEATVPAHKLSMALADSLLRQGRLEEADRAVRLATRFSEAEQAASAREETRWREERERLTKWWAEKQIAFSKLQTATQHALEQIQASLEEELSRSADSCCPKCGRRMDYWPEEVERPDDDEESGLDGSGAEEFGSVDSVEFRTTGSVDSGSVEFSRDESGDGEPSIAHWSGD